MNILAIDTSNQVLGVALLKDGQIAAELVTNVEKNHSVRLMPAIDYIMKEANLMPDQLDRIAVAKGPGSYTGVRIGIATVKSMAWALDIPVAEVSSLEVLTYQGRCTNALICPFFDARRQMVFTGLYQWKDGNISLIGEEKNIAMNDWLGQLVDARQEILFLSPDIPKFKDMIKQKMGDLAIIPEASFHLPKPSHLALAGLGKQPDATHAITPNYLRLAEAEANWQEKQKEKQKEKRSNG